MDAGDSSSESEMGNFLTHQALNEPPAQAVSCYSLRPAHDLMSLVEKGKIGISSNSSCCSSTNSSVGEKHSTTALKSVGQINVQRLVNTLWFLLFIH